MIYLLVDLKIVLALHLIKIEADLKGALIRGRGANSNRGAYHNLKSYGGAKPSRGAKPRIYGIQKTISLSIVDGFQEMRAQNLS